MTVRFLTGKGRLQSKPDRTPPVSPSHYKNGYKACMDDIQQLLSSNDSYLLPDAKESLLQHLQTTVTDKCFDETSNMNNTPQDSPSNCTLQNNSITINSSFNGESRRAKLAINSGNSSSPNLTVYIPPSNTWSPPVAKPLGLDNLCSPPSSPESTRTVSPSDYTESSPTSKILQPHNSNTGKQNYNYSNNVNQLPYVTITNTSRQVTNNYSSSNEIHFPENKVIQQFKDMHPFQVSTPQSPSPSTVQYNGRNSYLIPYSEPQSVPLNLAAPKSQIKAEKPEEVVTFQSRYQVILPRAAVAIGACPPHPDLMHEESPWRPWFN